MADFMSLPSFPSIEQAAQDVAKSTSALSRANSQADMSLDQLDAEQIGVISVTDTLLKAATEARNAEAKATSTAITSLMDKRTQVSERIGEIQSYPQAFTNLLTLTGQGDRWSVEKQKGELRKIDDQLQKTMQQHQMNEADFAVKKDTVTTGMALNKDVIATARSGVTRDLSQKTQDFEISLKLLQTSESLAQEKRAQQTHIWGQNAENRAQETFGLNKAAALREEQKSVIGAIRMPELQKLLAAANVNPAGMVSIPGAQAPVSKDMIQDAVDNRELLDMARVAQKATLVAGNLETTMKTGQHALKFMTDEQLIAASKNAGILEWDFDGDGKLDTIRATDDAVKAEIAARTAARKARDVLSAEQVAVGLDYNTMLRSVNTVSQARIDTPEANEYLASFDAFKSVVTQAGGIDKVSMATIKMATEHMEKAKKELHTSIDKRYPEASRPLYHALADGIPPTPKMIEDDLFEMALSQNPLPASSVFAGAMEAARSAYAASLSPDDGAGIDFTKMSESDRSAYMTKVFAKLSGGTKDLNTLLTKRNAFWNGSGPIDPKTGKKQYPGFYATFEGQNGDMMKMAFKHAIDSVMIDVPTYDPSGKNPVPIGATKVPLREVPGGNFYALLDQNPGSPGGTMFGAVQILQKLDKLQITDYQGPKISTIVLDALQDPANQAKLAATLDTEQQGKPVSATAQLFSRLVHGGHVTQNLPKIIAGVEAYKARAEELERQNTLKMLEIARQNNPQGVVLPAELAAKVQGAR